MQKPKCSLKLYSDFLIANQNRYSGLEMSKVAPVEIAHDYPQIKLAFYMQFEIQSPSKH